MDNRILDLIVELQTIAWVGEDEGWDLAVDSVSNRILKVLTTAEKQKFKELMEND